MRTCLNCNSENPDDARYCASCRFTLDWSTTVTDDPTQILPRASGPPLEVAMGPREVRVRPGGSAAFRALVANRGAGRAHATLQLAGEAAPYATVRPEYLDLAAGATGPATVTVSVPAGTRPQTISVSLYVAQADATATSIAAHATLIVEEASAIAHSGEDRRRLVAIVLGLVATALVVVAVAALGFGGGGGGDGDDGASGDGGGGVTAQPEGDGGEGDGDGDGGGGGVTGRGLAERGVCVHSSPDLNGASRIPEGSGCLGIEQDEEFQVACAENDELLKLEAPDKVAGRWIGSRPDLVKLDGEPGPC